MTTYTGTEGDDDFIITNFVLAGDQFLGLGGQDTLVVGANQGILFYSFQGTVLSSIEHLEFINAPGTSAFATFDLAGNPFTAPGSTITGSAGNNNVSFLTTAGGDHTVPTVTLINWDPISPTEFVGLLASLATSAVTLRANEALDTAQTLTGGSGNDTLIGHSGLDLLTGGLGNDTILGLAGDDILRLANNNLVANPDYDQSGDTVDGGIGEDIASVTGPVIAGNLSSVEHIQFMPANAIASAPILFLYTSRNADFLANANFVGTTSGTVVLNFDTVDNFDGSGITFDDQVFNGTLVASNLEVAFEFFGNDNDNYIGGTSRADTIHGGNGINVLVGNAGDDALYGGDSTHFLSLDILRGGAGDDLLDGGGGFNDQVTYSLAPSGVTVDLSLAGAQDTGEGFDTLIDVENLTGSAFDDQLTGNEQNNQLRGGAGSDILIGGGGGDRLEGEGGTDYLYGGEGGDRYYVDSQADLIFESAEASAGDQVYSTASHYLYQNVEELYLAAGAGDLFGVGNASNNIIEGNEGANLLIGGGGNDTLRGLDGSDSLFGEDGNDTLVGGAGIDFLVGGDGDDEVYGGDNADAVYGGDGNDNIAAGEGFFTDTLVGGAGNDSLQGHSGLNDYDLMYGGSGDDQYLVDTTWDLTFEGVDDGTDTVYATINLPNAGVYLWSNIENLVLEGSTTFGVGNELNNELTGNAEGNWLLGGAGNDTINGKAGWDVLFGEAGADTFVFEEGTGGDVIGDFNAAEDTIDLSDINFASFAQLQTAFVQNGAHGAINLGNGDFIVLHNVTMASLDAGDFVL